jgi:hypothetical protein
MHIPKKGLRALGIAESFAGRTHSTLAGVVMRKDLRIDGFVFGTVEVGGMDATDTILQMVEALHRSDINVIMLSGCVIAWFNIIDPLAVFNKTGIPVIGITYEASEGLLSDILFHFPSETRTSESGHKCTFTRGRRSLFVRGASASPMPCGCAMISLWKEKYPNLSVWPVSAHEVFCKNPETNTFPIAMTCDERRVHN